MLGLQVILRTSSDGRISAGGGLFCAGDLLPSFARFSARRIVVRDNSRLRIFVGHGDRPEQGERLIAQLRLRLPADRVEFISLTDMGPAIGVHGGPGTLVVAIHQTTGNAAA